MIPTLFVLLVFLGVALHVMTPDERRRAARGGLARIRRPKDATAAPEELSPFHEALRARTRLALVTPAILIVNVAIFTRMLAGAGSLSDPATLVAWGGNFGPSTTNGEWWRLVTAMFVHRGALQLLVNVGALVQIGLMLERLVGHLTFAAVYVAAGVFASLVSLATDSVTVSTSASGAVAGIYGLLVASVFWGVLNRSCGCETRAGACASRR